MYFNFNLFSILATRAYEKLDVTPYTLDNVLYVFKYYFQIYEDTFREVHPPIRVIQIERIINLMPYWDGNSRSNNCIADIDVGDYETIIDKHFQTQYRNCDYNINHFFSGDIRLLRYYEECY